MKTMVNKKKSGLNSFIKSVPVQNFLAGIVNVSICFLSDENIIIPVPLTEVGRDNEVEVTGFDQSVLLFRNCRVV